MLKITNLEKLQDFGFKLHITGSYWVKSIETATDEIDVEIVVDVNTKEICLHAYNDTNLKGSDDMYFLEDGSDTYIDLDLIYDLIIAGVVVKC